jgi:hypothetical protein
LCLADHPFPREFGHLQNSCPMGILGTSSNLILCSEIPCCLPLRSLWTDFDVFLTFPMAKFPCQYFMCSAPLKSRFDQRPSVFQSAPTLTYLCWLNVEVCNRGIVGSLARQQIVVLPYAFQSFPTPAHRLIIYSHQIKLPTTV